MERKRKRIGKCIVGEFNEIVIRYMIFGNLFNTSFQPNALLNSKICSQDVITMSIVEVFNCKHEIIMKDIDEGFVFTYVNVGLIHTGTIRLFVALSQQLF